MEKVIDKKKNVLLSESGFTLMELIVVIGIIVILIALIVPRFNGMTDKANATSAQNEGRIALTALAAYVTGIDTQLNAVFKDDIAAKEINKTLGKEDGGPVPGIDVVVAAPGTAKLTTQRSGLTYVVSIDARKGKITEVNCTGDTNRCDSLLDSGLVTSVS